MSSSTFEIRIVAALQRVSAESDHATDQQADFKKLECPCNLISLLSYPLWNICVGQSSPSVAINARLVNSLSQSGKNCRNVRFGHNSLFVFLRWFVFLFVIRHLHRPRTVFTRDSISPNISMSCPYDLQTCSFKLDQRILRDARETFGSIVQLSFR